MKTITIVAIAGNKTEEHASAICKTAQQLPYPCEKLLFSPIPPSHPDIKWVPIDDWGTDKPTYLRKIHELILWQLPHHINTDFCILVQTDGIATNKNAWTDDFFNWDYIGAPIPLWETLCLEGNFFRRVGSGGFNWRSRKFLQASLTCPMTKKIVGEDIATFRIHYRHFEKMGCRFAPIDIALKWCAELRLEDHWNWNPNDSFGRHGVFDNWSLYDLSPWAAFVMAFKRSIRQGRLKKIFHL